MDQCSTIAVQRTRCTVGMKLASEGQWSRSTEVSVNIIDRRRRTNLYVETEMKIVYWLSAASLMNEVLIHPSCVVHGHQEFQRKIRPSSGKLLLIAITGHWYAVAPHDAET